MDVYQRSTQNVVDLQNNIHFRRTQDVLDPPITGWSLNLSGSASVIEKSSVNGFKLPDYRRLIANKENATTPLKANRTVIKQYAPYYYYRTAPSAGNVDWYRTNYYGFSHIVDDPMLTVSAASMDRAKAIAYDKLNSYVKGKQTPFEAQIFLGELRETLQLVSHPLQQSLRTINSFKNLFNEIKRDARNNDPGIGRKRGTEVAAKEISKSWLELQYALLPLMGDINTIINLIIKGKPNDIKTSFSGTDIVQVRKDEPITLSGYNLQRGTYVDRKAQCFLKAGITVSDVTDYTGIAEYLNQSLRDFDQVVPTIWELTPYSFLVDYFVNVGDILDSLAQQGKISLSYSSESLVYTDSRIEVSKITSFQPGYFKHWRSYKGDKVPFYSAVSRAIDRKTISNVVPPIVFHWPGSDVRWANINALLLSKIL